MPKELGENIRVVVSSWFCFVRAGFYYDTGPFLHFFSWWHPLKKFKTSSQLHKLISLFHVCSAWNHSLNWKRLRRKPVKDAADGPAFIHSVTALTGHPWPPLFHLLIPLSLHAPPHPENEVMKPSEEDWNQSRTGRKWWYVSLASSFPTSLSGTEGIWRRRDDAGMKHGATRSHFIQNIFF